jgi:hypothetical protein
MIGDIYALYKLLKEFSLYSANAVRLFKRNVTVLPGDRWIAERNSILRELKHSDTYLSVAYVKGKDGKSRYWSTDSGVSSIKFEKKIDVLIRRVVVFGEGMAENSILMRDDGSEQKICEWIKEQQSSGVDILTAKYNALMKGLSNLDMVISFREKEVRRAIKKNKIKNELNDAVWNELGREDAKIMDIGIYGMAAVGCQITGEMGDPLAFVLSKKKSDVFQAKKYFDVLCNHAEKFHSNP